MYLNAKSIVNKRSGLNNIKESIQTYEITLHMEPDCDEAVWCNMVMGYSTLTMGLV